MADPLMVLLRLRRLTVDEARLALADCLRTEAECTTKVRELDEAIERETNAASDVGADDEAVEEFAVWYRRIQKEQSSLAAALALAEARTHEARAVLAAGQSAMRAVEELVASQADDASRAGARREQHAIDEAAGRGAAERRGET